MPRFSQRKKKPIRGFKRTFVRRKQPPDSEQPKISAGLAPTGEAKTQIKKSVINDDPDVSEIEREIASQSQRLHQAIERTVTTPKIAPNIVDSPDQYDGIGSKDEHWQVIQGELQNEQKKTTMLSHQIGLLQQDFAKEREEKETLIKELKRDLHRSQPLHEHTFFTLSKELKESMAIMNQLVTDQGVNQTNQVTQTDQTQSAILPPLPVNETLGVSKAANETPSDKREVIKEPAKPSQDQTNESKPNNKKKKTLLTGAAIVALMIITGGAVGSRSFMKPKVNDALVKEYLSNSGQVAGSSDTQTETDTTTPAPTKATLDLSQADIPLDQTSWTKLNEPIMGVSFEYPQNVVKINKTDSSITLIRKDGYIFKVQKINTAINLDEYWQQIKATNPNYSEEKTEYNGHKALALTLQEMTPFPGDRYMVKVGDSVFDVWYATPSESYSKDDLTRVKRIVDSVSFTNPDDL